jgi:hypothetical protein
MKIGLAWIGILAGLGGLAINSWEILSSSMTVSADNPVARSLPDALVYFWTFFTHLTNLWLLLIYAAELSGARWLAWFRLPVIQASAAAFITLVMLFYHFILAPNLHLEGGLAVANYLLHYLAPILYLVWWAIAARHGSLRWGQLPQMLLPGVAYVAWVLLRGAVVGEYPYNILDAGRFGYLRVAMGVGVLLVVVSFFCAALVLADGWLAQRRRAATSDTAV